MNTPSYSSINESNAQRSPASHNSIREWSGRNRMVWIVWKFTGLNFEMGYDFLGFIFCSCSTSSIPQYLSVWCYFTWKVIITLRQKGYFVSCRQHDHETIKESLFTLYMCYFLYLEIVKKFEHTTKSVKKIIFWHALLFPIIIIIIINLKVHLSIWISYYFIMIQF